MRKSALIRLQVISIAALLLSGCQKTVDIQIVEMTVHSNKIKKLSAGISADDFDFLSRNNIDLYIGLHECSSDKIFKYYAIDMREAKKISMDAYSLSAMDPDELPSRLSNAEICATVSSTGYTIYKIKSEKRKIITNRL